MSSLQILGILVLTPRTLTVELVGVTARDELAAPLPWRLLASGDVMQEGWVKRPVLTLEGLVPSVGYVLEIEGWEPLALSTPGETALIDIRDYGAVPGAADNSGAFADAVAAAPAGGTLYVPPGTWRTGPVFLKSDLFVHLPAGAELKALADRQAYRILDAFDAAGQLQASWEGIPAASYASLITIVDARNVSIAGLGVIDGAGAEGDWWSWPKETRDGARRPRTVFANRCFGLSMAGITVRNSPSWTVHPLNSERMVFADLAIDNPPQSPNTDGLNPESARDVEIVGVRFSVGDDCIAIKAGKIWPDGRVPEPTRNVSVRHCRMERGHGGVVIGSEMSGSVSDVTVTDCTFIGTDRGLRIKTRRGRGGTVAAIVMRDCMMDGVRTPLAINAHYFCDPDGTSDAVQNRAPAPVTAATPRMRDIVFSRIEARNVHHALAYVLGLAEAPIAGLAIEDVSVTYDPAAHAHVPEMALGLPKLRHAGIVTENTIHPIIRRIAWPDDCNSQERA